jgi:hypothetical protein
MQCPRWDLILGPLSYIDYNISITNIQPDQISNSDPVCSLVATSADSVPSSYLVRITIAPIRTTFGNLQWRRYLNNFTFEYSSNNNIFSFVAMSADSVPSSKTNIFQNKLIYFRTYSQCLIEVIRSSGEEMWCVDAYQIPYYSRGIEGEKRTHPEVCRLPVCY